MEDKMHIELEELQRKCAQLQIQERKFRDIIERLPETVFEMDLQGNLTFVNEAGLALFGFSRDDYLAGINAKTLIHQDDIPRMESNIEKILSGDRNQSDEYLAIKKDGSVFPVLVHSRLITKDNNPSGMRGVLMDLTENYRIRRQLEREKDFVNSLLDTANSLVICLDVNENIILFNKECERLTGYKLAEVRGKNWPRIFIPAESRRKSGLPFSEWIKIHPEDRYDAPLLTKSGEIKTVLWSNTVFSPKGSNEIIALAIGHDVTEEIRAVRALQESEQHFRAVWDNMPVGICLTDRDGIYRYVNPAYCRIYGFAKEDLIGRIPDGLIFPPADPEERMKHYNERFDKREITPLSEQKFFRSDGSPVWVELTSDFINENGRPKFRVTMNVDITSRKSAESALKESEHRYDLLFQNVSEAVTMLNRDGVFVMINNAAAAYLGEKPADIEGKTIAELFPPDVAERQMANTREVINKSERKFLFQDYTFSNQSRKWFKIGIYPVKDRNNMTSHALLIAYDVTEEIRREEILKARFRLLDNLRNAAGIDECLELGCRAVFEMNLFKRAVLTFHNDNREITNLGHVGLEERLIKSARTARAPGRQLAKKIMRRKFRISNSYFIPAEAGLDYSSTKRYIPPDASQRNAAVSWKGGDELFVPVQRAGGKIEGWLSVDTPFDGQRPSYETIRLLEETTDIVTQRAREILYQKGLVEERKATEEKNVAMKEILDHIQDEKAKFKLMIADNIEQVILPTLKRLSIEPGAANESILNMLRVNLKNLTSVSAGITRLHSILSPREIQICTLIKDGYSSKEISSELNIALATVHKHREIIRRKIGIIGKKANLSSYLNNL